jgi:uncharacterized membrane protein YuzA (DUF378 family)
MKYTDLQMYHIMLVLVLIGGINWGTTALGYNLVEIIHVYLNNLFKTETYYDKVIYIVVGLAAVKLLLSRDVWLPFLGSAAFPSTLVPLKEKKGDTTITVNVEPNVKVAYWASQTSSEKIPDVFTAYGDFSNSGVVMSDNTGVAKLVLNKGTSYTVPSMTNKEISRHVHYRVLDTNFGMIGPVDTVYY